MRQTLTGRANLLDRKVKKLRTSTDRTDKQLVTAAKKYAKPRGIPVDQAQRIVCAQSERDGQQADRLTKRRSQLRQKASRDYTPGVLHAELIDSAEIQGPRKATGFDYWIMIRGTTFTRGKNGGFYIPANSHHGLNKTLALPGATLNEGAEVFRKNGKWYARVSVKVPCPNPYEPRGFLGCDVGVRKSVTRSDGYHGPDLRPVLKKQRDRRAMQQKHGIDKRSNGTFQKQTLAREAKRAVSVAQRARQGVSLEDPKRLPRWEQWAGKFFAERVLLLCQTLGVAVQLVSPPYTSITCHKCGSAEAGQRHKELFRCWHCGFTHNADYNAAQNIAARAYRITAVSPGLLRTVPRGGGAAE